MYIEGDSLPRAIRGILVAHLNKALLLMERRGLTGARAHDIRKHLKRARALLRLMRNADRDSQYRRDNKLLRDAGRSLTAIRDGKVLAGALDRLLEKSDSEPLGALSLTLRLESQQARRRFSAAKRSTATYAMRTVRRHARALDEPSLNDLDLIANLRRTYKKARKSQQQARRDGTDESLHEWRKQTKHFLYQLDALHSLDLPRSKYSARLREAADSLSDRLGDDHDLALLSERLPENRQAGALAGKIDRERRKLQRQARKFGARLFTESPRRAAQRLARVIAKPD